MPRDMEPSSTVLATYFVRPGLAGETVPFCREARVSSVTADTT